ncbi:MAG: HDOD domain-containing protein [Planctomycetota bacterium]
MNGRVVTQEQDKVLALVKEAVDLHTLPVVVLEADRLMRDQRTSAQDIAKVISRDIALAERVLRLANSAYYGFQRRIGNLTQAVVLLGFQTVRNLLLTVSVIDSFRPGSHDKFDYPAFWAHSVATAIIAGEVGRQGKFADAEEGYVAGLLHDVGTLLIAQHFPVVQHQISTRVANGECKLEAERAILGLDHSDVGSKLAVSWGLPQSVTAAIRDHHVPSGSMGNPTLSEIVQLSDCLAHAFGFGAPVEPLMAVCDDLSLRLGYDEARLASWIEACKVALDDAAEFFEFIGSKAAEVATADDSEPANITDESAL